MAKLKLPFELEKPSPNEFVTQAGEVGYGEGSVKDALDEINTELNGSSPIEIILDSANDVRRHIALDNGVYIWKGQTANKHQCISCVGGDKFTIIANGANGYDYAFLKSYDAEAVDNDTPAPAIDWATGYNSPIHAGYTSTIQITAPSDAHFLYIEVLIENYDCRPSSIVKGEDEDGIKQSLNNKVDKIVGKGLSKNDYTDTDKTKVASIDTISDEVNNINNLIEGSQLELIDINSENDVIRYIRNDTTWAGAMSGYAHQCIPCVGGDKFTLEGNGHEGADYAFLKSYDAEAVAGETPPTPDYAQGWTGTARVARTGTVNISAPNDALWLYIETKIANSDSTPIVYKGEYVQSLEDKILSKAGALMDLSSLSTWITDGYITNKVFNVVCENSGISMPMLVTIRSKYTGATAPTLQFSVGTYTSIIHYIGVSEDCYVTQQFRIPPMIATMPSVTVRFNVPSGTYLYIQDFNVSYDSSKYISPTGLRINSHLGVIKYAPSQTMPAFEAAAMLGYRACIVNPVRTSDGIWMCYHGGTQYLSTDGTKETTVAIADNDFKNYTYAQIRAYEVVTSNAMHTYWQGCQVPTMAEFFELCSKTGMKPVFSVHPTPNSSEWLEIKALLMKYNLLEDVCLKLFSVADAEAAYAIFGDVIDSYIVITYTTTSSGVTDVCSAVAASTIANTTCRIGIEIGDAATYTQECIGIILTAGYYPTIETYSENFANTEAIKAAIRYGATEFTDDVLCCCNGLNW